MFTLAKTCTRKPDDGRISRMMRGLAAMSLAATTMTAWAGCGESGMPSSASASASVAAPAPAAAQNPPPSPAPAPATAQPPASPAAKPPGQGGSIMGPPPVQFQPSALDLGTVKPSGNATGTIMVHNISDKWLTVKASKASCTCTAINLGNTRIAPGQAVPLDVSYHASSTMGPKQAAVRIWFEGYDIVEVPITAFVGLTVRSDPMYIDALKHDDGTQTLAGQFAVFSLDKKPFRVLAINGKPPTFVGFNPSADSPRNSYVIKWDFTGYDPGTCKNAAGERLPGWIIVETDHPEAPIFDLEVRHLCNLRQAATRMDTWALSDKRVLLGAVKPGESAEVEVLAKWLPKREHVDEPRAVVSESAELTVQLVKVTPNEDGMLVTLKITPSKTAKGLVYGTLRLHSNRQSGAVVVIGTVRE